MLKNQEDNQYLNQLVRELTDISSSDVEVENFDHVSYIIKEVFESGRELQFTVSLSQYVSLKNSEIEKVCFIHYQEFVQSIDQLLKVKMSTNNFKNEIIDLNNQVQNTGYKLIEKKKEIIETRRTLMNVELALQTMHSCLCILDMANKVQTRIENRKYYTALRLLETLEENHLQKMKDFTFVQKMIESIPATHEIIRAAVLREMRDWFLTLKESSNLLGKKALALEEKNRQGQLEKYSNIDEKRVEINDQENDQDKIFDTMTIIDFTPLHQCIHIHDFLGKGNMLKLIYDENRRIQSEDHLKRVFTFRKGENQEFQEYMEGIAGFFIIEAVVMESTQDFRSRHQVELLWEISTTKLLKIFSDSLYECTDPNIILDIKQTVVSFIHTLERYGYMVVSLMELMVSLLDTWAKLVKLAYTKELLEILERDDFSLMILTDMAAYEAVKFGYPSIVKDVARFGVDDDISPRRGRAMRQEGIQLRFPIELTFSRSFPETSALIRKFIADFFQFAEGFQQQSNEIDDMLRKSLENILVQSLNGTLLKILSKCSISVAIQIFYNCPYWIKSCEFFEELLMERKPHMAKKVVLQATQSFTDTRTVAEKRIYEIICQKMGEFLEMEDYNWMSTVTSSQPSAYLLDLANYLRVIASSSLATLPATMIPTIFRECFEFFSKKLMAYFVGPEIKKISFQFLSQLSLDLKFLSGLIKEEYPYLQEEEIFSEMTQLVSFIEMGDYQLFLDPVIRAKKFKFRTQTLILVMEKFREEVSFFSSISAEQRTRSKKIESFITELKMKQSATK